MDKEILNELSYGMFILGTQHKGKLAGCFVNTLVQVTSKDVTIAVSVNKNNYTNKVIKASKKFAVSVLSTTTNPQVISTFGLESSKSVNKFESFKTELVDDQPIVEENICGYLVCELVDSVSVGTHDVLIAKVTDAQKLTKLTPMTYAYYQNKIKGATPKSAPTYVENKKAKTNSKASKNCKISIQN